jgi:hypothetical protein
MNSVLSGIRETTRQGLYEIGCFLHINEGVPIGAVRRLFHQILTGIPTDEFPQKIHHLATDQLRWLQDFLKKSFGMEPDQARDFMREMLTVSI